MTVVLLLSASYLRESTEECWAEMAESLVELSRPGCESLDFKLTVINPSTVGYREQFHQHSYSCTYIANHNDRLPSNTIFAYAHILQQSRGARLSPGRRESDQIPMCHCHYFEC